MNIPKIKLILAFLSFFFLPLTLHAQEKKATGPPPAKVVVAEVKAGMIAPERKFIGTVYFREVSDVASQVSGGVEKVSFEEGDRVKKGYILTRLDTALLEKKLQSTKAIYGQVLSDLEEAGLDLRRTTILFKEGSVAERQFDEYRFKVKGLEKKALSLKSDAEYLEVELMKGSVRAPFDGIVIKRNVDRGEWVSSGSIVAIIARDDAVDIVVNVPEEVIHYLKPGITAQIKAGGKDMKGQVSAIIPRGNVSTRTIPVKLRVKNQVSLIEGMEAMVTLPVGEKSKVLMVSRDAVIAIFGKVVVFAILDGKAIMIPVKVIGYKGMETGVYAKGLKKGQKVVIKGNERLRNGQAVEIIKR